MDSFKEDYYSILNLKFNASADEVKRAYKQLAKIYHPDCGGSEHLFLRIKEAYEVLSNPTKRTEYDKWYLQKHQSYNNRYYNQTKDNSESKDTKREFFVSIFDAKTREIFRSKQRVDTRVYPESQYAYYNEYYAIKMYSDGFQKVVFYPREIWLQKINDKYEMEDDIKTKHRIKKIFKISVAVIAIIMGIYLWHNDPRQDIISENSNNDADYGYSTTEEEDYTLIGYEEKPIPEHGTMTTQEHINTRKATFEVKLPKASKKYYFIKLVDAETDESVFSVFMHPGTTLKMKVPYGTFKLKFASGDVWYGWEDLFGPYGSYNMSDDIFEFNYNLEWSVTLYSVSNGNMKTDPISYDEF